MGTPKETNSTIKDFESILNKFFKRSEVVEFTERFARTIDRADLSEKFHSEDEGLSVVTESFFSANTRMVADRLITHAERNLERTEYLRFIFEFAKLLSYQGELNQAMELLSQVRDETEKIDGQDALKANTYLELGIVLKKQALWKDCFQHIKSARQLFENIDDRDGLGMCEFLMGAIYLEQGDIDASNVRFENCLRYFTKDIDPKVLANIDNNFGVLRYIEAKYDDALEFYNKALNAYIKLKDVRKEAEARQNIGMALLKVKKYREAIVELDKAITISYENRYLETLMVAYMHKAVAYIETDKFDLAMSFSDKSMEICYQLNDKLSIADLYKIKGIICRKIKVFDLAEEYFLTSLRINRDLGNELNYAETAFELGSLYNEMENVKTATALLEDALNYYKKINSKPDVAKINSILAGNTG